MTILAIAILVAAVFGGLTLFIAMEQPYAPIGDAAISAACLLGALAVLLGVIGGIFWAIDHLSGSGVTG